jgi:hypothetical protein
MLVMPALQELLTQAAGKGKPGRFAEVVEYDVPPMDPWVRRRRIQTLIDEVARLERKESAEKYLWPQVLDIMGLPEDYPKPGPRLCDKVNWAVRAIGDGEWGGGRGCTTGA